MDKENKFSFFLKNSVGSWLSHQENNADCSGFH